MAGPSTPAIASSNIPPPAFNLPFVHRDQAGQFLLTSTAIEFLQTLWAAINGADGVIDGLDGFGLAPSSDGALSTVADVGLGGAPNGVDSTFIFSALADLGIGLSPPLPQYSAVRYGSFYDTTDQTAAAINTAYAATFNTTSLSQGVYLGTPASRIYVDRPGLYSIQGGAQFTQAAAATSHAWYWLRLNGTDVANSASQITLAGAGSMANTSAAAMMQLAAGDYIEVMWAVDDTNIKLDAAAAAAPVPGIPSVTLTVYELNLRRPT